ncbi:TPA: hypothetical protein ACN4AY_004611 [Vibrio parahaemolyticus]
MMNVKSILQVSEGFLLSANMGIGNLDTEIDKSQGSDSARQFGLESIYRLNNGMFFSLGYRKLLSEVDGVDVTISGFNSGIGYSF